MIIEDLDQMHNLHIGINLTQAKLLVSLLSNLTKDAFEAAEADTKVPLADIVAVVKQATYTLSPWTNQVRVSAAFEGTDHNPLSIN